MEVKEIELTDKFVKDLIEDMINGDSYSPGHADKVGAAIRKNRWKLRMAEDVLQFYACPINWRGTIETEAIGQIFIEKYIKGDLGERAREYFQSFPQSFKGKEAVEAQKKDCILCDGKGEVPVSGPEESRGEFTRCINCDGTGKV